MTARQTDVLRVLSASAPEPLNSAQLADALCCPAGPLMVTLRSLQRCRLIVAVTRTARHRSGWRTNLP